MAIPGDLVTKVTVNREVKVHGGPIRKKFSSSVEAVDDFRMNVKHLATIRNSHTNKKTH